MDEIGHEERGKKNMEMVVASVGVGNHMEVVASWKIGDITVFYMVVMMEIQALASVTTMIIALASEVHEREYLVMMALNGA